MSDSTPKALAATCGRLSTEAHKALQDLDVCTDVPASVRREASERVHNAVVSLRIAGRLLDPDFDMDLPDETHTRRTRPVRTYFCKVGDAGLEIEIEASSAEEALERLRLEHAPDADVIFAAREDGSEFRARQLGEEGAR